MSGIFICYRREDTQAYARLLSDALAEHFGPQEVFRDIDAIGPGALWRSSIADAVGECDGLIALIGTRWLTATHDGRRRLDDPDDYVRIEIAAALRRDVLVIPTLIEGAPIPRRAELPEEIAELVDRNAHRLTDEAWDAGVQRLVTALTEVVTPLMTTPAPSATPSSTGWPPLGGAFGAGRSGTPAIVGEIHGGVSGQVAIGNDIRQSRVSRGSGSSLGADERSEVRRLFAAERAQVEADAPTKARAGAIERLLELEQAVLADEPDVTTVHYVRRWFASHLPGLADSVNALLTDPAVRRFVDAANSMI